MDKKSFLVKQYELLKDSYGFTGGLWSMFHTKFSNTYFEANREDVVKEYCELEDFVKEARKVHFAYFLGIDQFLRAYKDAVYTSMTKVG